MYYVRKLSRRNSLNKIKCATSIEDIPADVLRLEMSTKENSLSFWKCDSLDENLRDTIMAILFSTTSIDVSQFIIFSDELLRKYDIKINDDKAGQTGYKTPINLHVDFCELTYQKIGDILSMIKEILTSNALIPVLYKEEVKSYIRDGYASDCVDETMIREELLNDIKKYNLNN